MSSTSGRSPAPRCPFCGAELQRPVEMSLSAMESAQGGTCSCGAIYLVDPTGKNVGTIMVQALAKTAEVLNKAVTDLVPDQDYEDAILSYDWRTHRSTGATSGYRDGYGRLYLIRVKTETK